VDQVEASQDLGGENVTVFGDPIDFLEIDVNKTVR
jgi:hypothetical protein